MCGKKREEKPWLTLEACGGGAKRSRHLFHIVHWDNKIIRPKALY